MHAVPLTERVIEVVRRDPGASALPYVNVPWVEGGEARPMAEDVLAEAVFPSGRPLPPSLRAWLAYDTGLLERYGWFTPDGDFAPRPLHQVFALDLDDMPYLGLMYPGFDVYLADTAGLLELGERQTYTDLVDHGTYGPRMRGHAVRCFAGESCVEYPFEFAPVYEQLYPGQGQVAGRPQFK